MLESAVSFKVFIFSRQSAIPFLLASATQIQGLWLFVWLNPDLLFKEFQFEEFELFLFWEILFQIELQTEFELEGKL